MPSRPESPTSHICEALTLLRFAKDRVADATMPPDHEALELIRAAEGRCWRAVNALHEPPTRPSWWFRMRRLARRQGWGGAGTWALLLLAVSACAPLRWNGLVETERAGVVYSRPAEYDRWWNEVVAACQCQPKTQLGEIAWYTLRPGNDHKFPCGVERCVGWWWESDQVFIAAGYTRLEWLVKHEMLHAMLHDGSHRHPLFNRDLSQGGVAAPLHQAGAV